jgi:hypothetical protein
VPKKGLEPPHPCEYVDLNHARLPIPPLRHNTQSRRLLPVRQHLQVSQMSGAVSNIPGLLDSCRTLDSSATGSVRRSCSRPQHLRGFPEPSRTRLLALGLTDPAAVLAAVRVAELLEEVE